MSWHRPLLILAWLAVAAATAAVAMVALNIVGAGILGSDYRSLSAVEVTRELAAVPTKTFRTPPPTSTVPDPAALPPVTTTQPSPDTSTQATAPSSSTATTPVPRGLSTPGGTIVAQCDGTLVTLISWSPAQGYRTDDVYRGPATTATIKFKTEENEIEVSVTCQNGQPQASTQSEESHSGKH